MRDAAKVETVDVFVTSFGVVPLHPAVFRLLCPVLDRNQRRTKRGKRMLANARLVRDAIDALARVAFEEEIRIRDLFPKGE